MTLVTELMPGDVALGYSGQRFKTLLGSCVCVILTDPRRTVGALCHIVHAGPPSQLHRHNTAYAQPAFDDMFARLQSVGLSPVLCQAYVYGGGNMFPNLVHSGHVGQRNSECVLSMLAQWGIAVVEQSVGGNGYRTVSWTVGPQTPVVQTVYPESEAEHGH